jgi:hypothetical protein
VSADQSLHYFYVHTFYVNNVFLLLKNYLLFTYDDSGGVYLLPPSSQPASVSVNITVGGTTKTYTYSTSDELEAGYKINIDGTYTEAVGVNLTGTITGATWLGERTISSPCSMQYSRRNSWSNPSL